jgi:hypothetical protein
MEGVAQQSRRVIEAENSLAWSFCLAIFLARVRRISDQAAKHEN